MKTFDDDFYKFLNKIKNNTNFALSRWGDGELSILEKRPIDIRSKGNGEFRYDPNLSQYDNLRDILLYSYLHKDDEYYIGISCPCCVGDDKFFYMKSLSEQDEDHLTWANIFVNANYYKTINELVPELKNHTVNLVINEKSKTGYLPFDVKNVWHVGTDAWYENYDVSKNISKYIKDNNIKNELFLFAAGPLANILTYELWSKCSNENTYIDIGSILDPLLNLKLTRGYQLGASTLNKICVWKTLK